MELFRLELCHKGEAVKEKETGTTKCEVCGKTRKEHLGRQFCQRESDKEKAASRGKGRSKGDSKGGKQRDKKEHTKGRKRGADE